MQKILVCALCRGAACGEWKIENGKWKVKSFQVCHSEERSDVGISGRQLRFRRWLSHDPAGYCEIATSAYGLLAMTSRGASTVLTAAGTDRGGPSRDCHVGLRPPRNDKSGAVTILTIHCANRPCSAGPGCPLPYKVQPGRQYRYCYIDSDYSIGQGGCQPGNNAGTS